MVSSAHQWESQLTISTTLPCPNWNAFVIVLQGWCWNHTSGIVGNCFHNIMHVLIWMYVTMGYVLCESIWKVENTNKLKNTCVYWIFINIIQRCKESGWCLVWRCRYMKCTFELVQNKCIFCCWPFASVSWIWLQSFSSPFNFWTIFNDERNLDDVLCSSVAHLLVPQIYF